MSVIDKIKSLLGIGGANRKATHEPETDPHVEVEREPDAVGTESDAPAAETDAAASTESLVDEEAAAEEPARAAEPAEAAGPEADDMTTDVADAEPDSADDSGSVETEPDTEAAEPDAEDTELEEDDTELGEDDAASDEEGEGAPDDTGATEDSPSVQEIKGIGPAYSDRLAAVGVETVADLAEADAADLAERTTVPESKLHDWIERAREYDQ